VAVPSIAAAAGTKSNKAGDGNRVLGTMMVVLVVLLLSHVQSGSIAQQHNQTIGSKIYQWQQAVTAKQSNRRFWPDIVSDTWLGCGWWCRLQGIIQ